jgi:hypothetical protein
MLSLTSYLLRLESFISFNRRIFMLLFENSLVDRLELRGVVFSNKLFVSGRLE